MGDEHGQGSGFRVAWFELARHGLAGAGALSFAHALATVVTLHLGDDARVGVALLVALALGFTLGAVTRDGPRAWLRSASVGALALLLTAILPGITELAVRGLLPTSPWGRTLAAFAVALGGSYVVGLSLSAAQESAKSRAAWLAGGAFGVVVVAMIGAREVGLQGALLASAFFALVPSVRHRRHAAPLRAPLPAPHAARFELATGATLGAFLETTRPIARNVMGPASENGVALTAGIALALAVATIAGARLVVPRARLLFVAALSSALATLFAPDLFALAIRGWQQATHPAWRGVVKLAFLVVLVAPTVFALGTAALARGRSARVLVHLALGVLAGLLVARFVLQPHVPDVVMLGAVAVLAAFVAFLATPRFARVDAGALVALSALLVLAVVRFPEGALSAGFLDAGTESSDESVVVRIDRLKRAGEELDVLRDSHGVERVRGAGHDDAVVIAGRPEPHELLTGAIPAIYTRSHERAFVFGGPGGVAAGAASRVFAHTLVVDESPVAEAIYARFSRHNFDLLHRDVLVQAGADPFTALAAAPGPFDAIVSAAPGMRDLAASKTMTLEFMRLARSRLAPGGVVAFAIERGVPISGLAVFLRTLSDSFDECQFVFLEPERYQVICGEALAPQTPRFPPDVAAALAPWTADMGLERFVDALLLVPQHFHGEWFPVPNTFDLPVLDHVMAREDTRKMAWDLDLALRFDLGHTAIGHADFTGPAVFERCFAMSVIAGGASLPRCSTMLRGFAARVSTAGHGMATGFPLPEGLLALSAAAWQRDVPSIVTGATLLAELLYAGEESRARELVAARVRNGTLTSSESTFAKRRHLL